ncbi:MAG: hypothetical protein M3164_00515 [Actinomycetota bacterium]|nr:hypothetical protein [Actinomycetota bacterium]
MQATTLTGNRHHLDGLVKVDRTWGRTIGAHQARGARRVGNFYQVPRSEYVRLMATAARSPQFAHPRQERTQEPCLEWTDSDDRAVAQLLKESARQEAPCG